MSWDDDLTYTQRVYRAYAEIAAERQNPDIPVHELYRRVGGSLAGLHDWLRAECLAHHCVPTVGEPVFASEEAKRAALTLDQPGASETFLNIKLVEPQPMQQKQPNIDNPGRWTHSAKAFAESASILELVEACERYGRDFSTEEAGVRYNAAAEELRRRDPKAYATWEEAEAYSPRQFFRERTAELSVEVQVQRYESLLRQTAEVRYPSEERTPQLQERIEATVRRKVGEFTQERKLKAYEAALQKELARLHPNLTPEQKREYEDRIAELVEAHREGLARQRQQTPPAQVRSQEQGIER